MERDLGKETNDLGVISPQLERLKIQNSRYIKDIKDSSDKLGKTRESYNIIQKLRQDSINSTVDKESIYKSELTRECQEKEQLKDRLKQIAYKVKAMQECLSFKNEQIGSIDVKIAELVRIRKNCSSGNTFNMM